MHGGGVDLLGVLLSQIGGVAAGGQLVLDLLGGGLSLSLGGIEGRLLLLVSQVTVLPSSSVVVVSIEAWTVKTEKLKVSREFLFS